MARKELTITITDEGRDKGKTFKIVEMAADQAEWWAIRTLLALGRANPELGAAYEAGMGMAALAVAGLKSFMMLDPMDAKPLLDEMMACVEILPDRNNPNIVRPLFPEDIEEITTRLKLRSEVFQLHTGFLLPGRRSS
jgi:hypothetical protein